MAGRRTRLSVGRMLTIVELRQVATRKQIQIMPNTRDAQDKPTKKL